MPSRAADGNVKTDSDSMNTTAENKNNAATDASGVPFYNSHNNKNAADYVRYSCDPEQLQKLRSESPWKSDPKYLRKVALSPSALMKVMMHCDSGVEKGIAKGGNPIEVMGMLLGRPDPTNPDTLVVTDAFPLPIEGFETRVIADDQDVVNHMIALGESLERTRKEKFMGWYHSHPFDLADHSHCFLSQTDLSTQLQWQRAEDPHGNPFVAIVVDPLRSKHLQLPELKAFRAYPPEYNSPVANQCPNGSIEPSEQMRLEQWGSCWNRYYELQMEYYISSTSTRVLEQLTQDYLWMRTLNRQPPKNMQRKLAASVKTFEATSSAAMGGGGGSASIMAPVIAAGASGTGGGSIRSAGSASSSRVRAEGTAAAAASGSGVAVAAATAPEETSMMNVFNNSNNNQERSNKGVDELVAVAADELCEATLRDTKKEVFS